MLHDLYSEATLDRNDQENLELKKAIRKLNTERNAIAPISQLPPELLAKIFQFITDDEGLRKTYRHWVAFSHASQVWREVALSTPNLWRVLTFRSTEWTSVMFERSKAVDLIIRSDICHPNTPERRQLVQLALSQVGRITEIDVSLRNPSGYLLELLSHFPRSAPSLRFLRIVNIGQESPCPAGFSLTEAPQLRHLELLRCRFHWNSNFSALSCLKISEGWCGPFVEPPSTRQFLDALREMPALVHLHLKHGLPSDNGTYMPVNLLRLKYLRLSSYMNNISNVLSHIIINRRTFMKLTCKDPWANYPTPDIPKFISALSSVMYAQESQPVHLNLITYDSGRSVGLRVVASEVEPVHSGTSCVLDPLRPCPRFILIHEAVSRPGNANEPRSMLQEILRMLGPKSVRTLEWHTHLSCGTGISSDLIIQTFEALPNLQKVCLSRDITGHFLSTLMRKPDGFERSQVAWDINTFPSLHTLMLEQFCTSTDIEALQECLMERCERNAPIQNLTISLEAEVAESDVKILQELVVKLEVLGTEQALLFWASLFEY